MSRAACVRSFATLRTTDERESQSKIENRKSKIHHSGNVSAKLATPMSFASGILGFGLRIRAR